VRNYGKLLTLQTSIAQTHSSSKYTHLFLEKTVRSIVILQIDALLPNVRPRASRIAPLERALFALHSVLNAIPSRDPQPPLIAARAFEPHIAVPYPQPLPHAEAKWKVAFAPPTDITLVGSWPLDRAVKAVDGLPFGVDLAVEMPESLFQEKDYLDGRFFHKRAFYLASIAAAINDPGNQLGFEIKFESASNDPRLTTLVLFPIKDESPNDFSKLNACIRIIPTLSPSSAIPIHRLSPSHSNIRIPATGAPKSSASQPIPTPLYNTALLIAFTPKPDLLAAHALSDAAPATRDALALLRVWAAQRGYASGQLCVRGFDGRGPWWSALLELLVTGEEPIAEKKGKVRRKPLGRGLSSYQLFRAALDFIGMSRDISLE
jgi:U3 small nucleolar RNA-associated protein 22